MIICPYQWSAVPTMWTIWWATIWHTGTKYIPNSRTQEQETFGVVNRRKFGANYFIPWHLTSKGTLRYGNKSPSRLRCWVRGSQLAVASLDLGLLGVSSCTCGKIPTLCGTRPRSYSVAWNRGNWHRCKSAGEKRGKIVCHLSAVFCGRKVNCLIFFSTELGSFLFV